MTSADLDALQELGRDIGQSVFVVTMPDGRRGVAIGAMVTADADRAYLALRGLEAQEDLERDDLSEPWGAQ